MNIVAGSGTATLGYQRFGSTRGRISGSPIQGVNYPSPFFDVAHTWLPTTVKQMFRWCRYYFLTNPLINATVFKLSEYPVTDIIVEHEDPEVVKQWTDYLQDHLRIRSFQIESGLDYHTYGNGLVGLACPFHKFLTCPNCKWTERANKCRNKWIFTSFAFRLTCPNCGFIGNAIAKDTYIKNASGIRLVRWNPEDMEIVYNDLTGDYTYFYTIPNTIKNDIVIGRKEIVETIPQLFIQALKEQKGIVFSQELLFHMRRPTLATQDRGWGIPLLLPVMKDTFYLQLMKKAQEAILLEHIVPLRIMFPQPGSGAADPYTSINLADWRDHVGQEIARWRMDNNYIPIMPLPLGTQTVGGDGRALLLTGEIQAWSEQLMVGLGVPREFLLGGMSYAGTNVSMRMLENQFLGYLLRQKQMVRWIVKEVAAFMDWPEVKIRFKPFKMADDLQRKAYLLQLSQLQKISDTTLLADSDLSVEEENLIMVRESDTRLAAIKKQQLATAEIQGESQMIMMKYQVKAQQEMQQAMAAPAAPGEPGDGSSDVPQGAQSPLGMQQQGGGMDVQMMAQMQAQSLSKMPQQMQQMALQNLQLQNPELAALVGQYLAQMQTGAQMGGPQVDGRPNPNKLPARRANPSV